MKSRIGNNNRLNECNCVVKQNGTDRVDRKYQGKKIESLHSKRKDLKICTML